MHQVCVQHQESCVPLLKPGYNASIADCVKFLLMLQHLMEVANFGLLVGISLLSMGMWRGHVAVQDVML
jgi:hypothetical protein